MEATAEDANEGPNPPKGWSRAAAWTPLEENGGLERKVLGEKEERILEILILVEISAIGELHLSASFHRESSLFLLRDSFGCKMESVFGEFLGVALNRSLPKKEIMILLIHCFPNCPSTLLLLPMIPPDSYS